jgi:hypothetical protein
VTCHLGLDLNSIENLAVVNTDYTANHFGDDDHVSEVGLDNCGFLVRGSFLLGFAQLFYETHWAALEATVELATGACMNEFDELFVVQVEELLKLDTTVGERAERSLLLKLSREGGVCNG